MSDVPVSSTYPTTADNFPTVVGTETLGEAQHSALHNLAHSALSAIQTHVGLRSSYSATGDLGWLNGITGTMNRLAAGITGLRAAVGSSGDSSAVSSVYGAIATVQGRVGLTSDPTSAVTAHGKINKINTTIGSSTDAHTANTVYGAIANAKKVSADAIGTVSDPSSASTVYGNIAKKLNLTGGTLTGALSSNSPISTSNGVSVTGGNLDVRRSGSSVFKVGAANPEFYLPVTVPTATADGHAPTKLQLDTGLAAKANKPGTGQAMLRFTSGQSANAVTVWMGNDPNALTSDPPVLDGNHANGSNVQLQWNAGTQKLRYHIDARTNVAGQNGNIGAGAVYRDLAPVGLNKPAAWPAANNAVMTHGSNDMGLMWFSNKVVLFVDNSQIGNVAFEASSSSRFKIVHKKERPDYLGFFDAVSPVVFSYLGADVVGAAWADQKHVGFIAEDIRDAAERFSIPADVVTYDDEGRPDGLSDRDLLAVLWAVVKDIRDNT